MHGVQNLNVGVRTTRYRGSERRPSRSERRRWSSEPQARRPEPLPWSVGTPSVGFRTPSL